MKSDVDCRSPAPAPRSTERAPPVVRAHCGYGDRSRAHRLGSSNAVLGARDVVCRLAGAQRQPTMSGQDVLAPRNSTLVSNWRANLLTFGSESPQSCYRSIMLACYLPGCSRGPRCEIRRRLPLAGPGHHGRPKERHPSCEHIAGDRSRAHRLGSSCGPRLDVVCRLAGARDNGRDVGRRFRIRVCGGVRDPEPGFVRTPGEGVPRPFLRYRRRSVLRTNARGRTRSRPLQGRLGNRAQQLSGHAHALRRRPGSRDDCGAYGTAATQAEATKAPRIARPPTPEEDLGGSPSSFARAGAFALNSLSAAPAGTSSSSTSWASTA